jgi:hypothetical protein
MKTFSPCFAYFMHSRQRANHGKEISLVQFTVQNVTNNLLLMITFDRLQVVFLNPCRYNKSGDANL